MDLNIDWNTAQAILKPFLKQMDQTPQEPLWHGEGNVLNHTKMVCQALVDSEDFQTASQEVQQCIWLAALLHDIGKITTTRQEDGRWVSPGHARVSAQMARELLWKSLCGSKAKLQMREAICSLIRFHTMPIHAISDADGIWKLRKAAAAGELAPLFQIERLCMLAQADIRGRICQDQTQLLEKVQLCRELAQEAGCANSTYPFPSAHTEFAYLSGRDIPAEYELYDDTWGSIILMSGLPGTGKDTWIQTHYSHLPMISLDEIRKQLGIPPTEPQAPIIDAARERAKELLRKKQPFVWNATNLTVQTRSKQVELFTAYGASTKIVYLETDWAQQLSRNAGRKDSVPEQAICQMQRKLEPPQRWEAACVQWHCV